jgi:hypothetical protein
VSLFLLRPAFAQEEGETPPLPTGEDAAEAKTRAAAILNEGNALFEQKKYNAALGKYESAYRIFPSPKILFNIAEAHRELGHAEEASTYYERFLKEANVEPGSVIHQKVTQRLESLKTSASYLAFESEVSGVDVKIDGRSAGRTPFDHPVRVGAGTHEIEATMPGYEPYRENIEVTTGNTASVRLALTPAAASPPAEVSEQKQMRDPDLVAQTGAPREEESVATKWWFWTAIGAVVVVAGVVVIAAASSHSNDFVPMGQLGSTSTKDWTKF